MRKSMISDSPVWNSIEPVQTLYHYDEALIFTAMFQGSRRLVTLIDRNDNLGQWLIASPDPALLAQVISSEAPLREGSLSGPFFLVTWENRNDDATIIQIDKPDLNWLPDDGVFLSQGKQVRIMAAKAIGNPSP